MACPYLPPPRKKVSKFYVFPENWQNIGLTHFDPPIGLTPYPLTGYSGSTPEILVEIIDGCYFVATQMQPLSQDGLFEALAENSEEFERVLENAGVTLDSVRFNIYPFNFRVMSINSIKELSLNHFSPILSLINKLSPCRSVQFGLNKNTTMVT